MGDAEDTKPGINVNGRDPAGPPTVETLNQRVHLIEYELAEERRTQGGLLMNLAKEVQRMSKQLGRVAQRVGVDPEVDGPVVDLSQKIAALEDADRILAEHDQQHDAGIRKATLLNKRVVALLTKIAKYLVAAVGILYSGYRLLNDAYPSNRPEPPGIYLIQDGGTP